MPKIQRKGKNMKLQNTRWDKKIYEVDNVIT